MDLTDYKVCVTMVVIFFWLITIYFLKILRPFSMPCLRAVPRLQTYLFIAYCHITREFNRYAAKYSMCEQHVKTN